MTSSTLAVFERIDLALVQDLLDAACGGVDLQAVRFENQVAQSAGSVPDARISGRFTWWFETKTVPGIYAAEGHGRQQARLHAKQLAGDPDARLFILTPDPARPTWFGQLNGIDPAVRDRVLWLSFRDLADAIDAVIADPARVIGEQTRFLLHELIALYETDGLLTTDDTVIVAARRAWPEYQHTGAYICQPGRAFRDGLTHLGFYADSAIQPMIASIRAHYSSVSFTIEEAARRRAEGQAEVADLIEDLLGQGTRAADEPYGVLLLSGPDSPGTVHLSHPVINDILTENGRAWGWTLSQRYTSLSRLQSGVTKTSEL